MLLSFHICISFSFLLNFFTFFFSINHSVDLLCLRWMHTLIYQDIEFSVSLTRKGIGRLRRESGRYAQVKRRDFTVTFLRKSDAVVCDTHVIQKDHLPADVTELLLSCACT